MKKKIMIMIKELPKMVELLVISLKLFGKVLNKLDVLLLKVIGQDSKIVIMSAVIISQAEIWLVLTLKM